MSSNPLHDERLDSLSPAERNCLESELMEFELAWTPESLTETSRRLQSTTEPALFSVLLGELVKIDMQRCWATGVSRALEHYLIEFPLLGTSESVDPALVLAECNARRGSGSVIHLDSIQGRFPNQYGEVKRLASEQPAQWGSSHMDSRGLREVQRQPSSDGDTSRMRDARDTKTEHSSVAVTKDIPTEFGRYRIIKHLGAGAMGEVLLAIDTTLDRHVALKIPRFQGKEFDDAVVRFYREAKAAAKLQHRNICPVYDVGEIDGQHFISMAYIKGRCLSDYVKPDSPPSARTSAMLIHRLARALAEAHHHNVIHRDLKPANIMIDTKREPVVMDFGLARQTDTESRLTQTGMAVGTPAYMSPEQVRGNLDEVGPRADVYALGVILYELLTGELPFRGAIAQVVYAIVNEPPTPIGQLRPGIDKQLEAICDKMMAKNLSERYGSMDDVATDLNRYLKTQRRRPMKGVEAATSTGQSSPAKSRSQSVGDNDGDSEEVSESGNESEVLNRFFADAQTDDPKGTRVESSVPEATVPAGDSETGQADVKLVVTEPLGRSTRGNSKYVGLALLGVATLGLALFSGAVIYFSDGSRVEVADGASAKIEVNAEGAISSVTIQPGGLQPSSLEESGDAAPGPAPARVDASGSEGASRGATPADGIPADRIPADRIPAGVTPYDLLTSEEYEWSDPTYLGRFPHHAENLDRELGGFLLTHYGAVARKKGGIPSLYVAQRNLGDSEWRSVERLGISSTKWDWNPSLSRDGLHLAFQSNRPGGKSPESDLWYSRRATTESPWSKAMIVYRGSSRNRDEKPCFAENGLAIYFNSARVKGMGTTSIVVTRRASLNHRWSDAETLGPEFEVMAHNIAPTLSADDRVLIFAARGNRQQGIGQSLWMSTREGIGMSWSKASRLDDKLSLDGQVLPMMISPDGRTLLMVYVSHGRADPTKIGAWVSHRVKR